MGKVIDLTGRRFGFLVATGKTTKTKNRVQNVMLWECKCDCGKLAMVAGSQLRNGKTRSCGCLRLSQKPGLRHGMYGTPEYRAYHYMKHRCYNENVKAFRHYGGRGIAVCDRWLHGDGERDGFECFLSDLGSKPSEQHSIERINVNGNYDPSNCRWATTKEQSNNKRNTRKINLNGESMSICDAISSSGSSVHKDVVACRLAHGWSAENALRPEMYRLSEDHKRKLSIAAKRREARKRELRNETTP